MTHDIQARFDAVRSNIIGIDQEFTGPFGTKRIIYADWIASGRLYRPIEDRMLHTFGPYTANTHTDSTVTGSTMTEAYEEAKAIIKRHVNAGPNDVLICTGTGMTGALAKLQRILGWKLPEQVSGRLQLDTDDRPVVFVTHAEHHSNQTSWMETICEVVIIPPDADGKTDLDAFATLLASYAHRSTLVAAVTAGSNVTGYVPPYRAIARMIHRAGGLCFVDFACAAPYVTIDMHPEDEEAWLDAIVFSPHKFLGGPGTCGVLVFNSALYNNRIPDIPGGGTVKWTNPWGQHLFLDDIEQREDGGTPPFLQTIRTALCVRLKEYMGVDNIHAREQELLSMFFHALDNVPGVHILAADIRDRIGVFSLCIRNLHHNLAVKMLNDRFGIQARGGCSCAGTYGHYLLELDREYSSGMIEKITKGEATERPGWIRISLHPLMTDDEARIIIDAIIDVSRNHMAWKTDYVYDPRTDQFSHITEKGSACCSSWFEFAEEGMRG
ncbi:MAG: aminotransferase class V-fold PLP-dependent enzyme [Candidatus Kapaibacterium sp.]